MQSVRGIDLQRKVDAAPDDGSQRGAGAGHDAAVRLRDAAPQLRQHAHLCVPLGRRRHRRAQVGVLQRGQVHLRVKNPGLQS